MAHFIITKGKNPACNIFVGSAKEDLESAELLQKKVKEISGVRLEIIKSQKNSHHKNQILIGSPLSNSLSKEILREKKILVIPKDKEIEENKRLLVPEDLGAQGFVIYQTNYKGKECLILSGGTSQGVFYAVITFINRLYFKGKNLIIENPDSSATPIINIPAFKYRSVGTNIGGPDWLGHNQWMKEWNYDYKGFIDWLASHKINNLNIWTFDLAFGIAYNSKKFPECVNRHHPNVKKEFIRDMIKYAHRRYIKIFFFIDFPDNWTAIIKAHPELAGKNVNPKKIPSGKEWEDYQKRGEGLCTGGEHFRTKFSWVCASNLKTMRFWKDYWNELLDRYPEVDGIGGQFAEEFNMRCNCKNCRDNFFQLQLKYFEEMAKIGKRKNPDIKIWLYDSWGTRDILKNKDKFPGLIRIDWGRGPGPFMFRHYVPRGNWYLYHRGFNEIGSEFGIRECAKIFNERGLEGYQIRGVHYKEMEQIYSAFEEFSWNPSLSIEDFARLYILRKLRRETKNLFQGYASWINIQGYKEILSYEKIGLKSKKDYQRRLEEEERTSQFSIARLTPEGASIGENEKINF